MITFLILIFTALQSPLAHPLLLFFAYGLGIVMIGFVWYKIIRNELPSTLLDLPWALLLFVALLSSQFSIWKVGSEVRILTLMTYITAYYVVYMSISEEILTRNIIRAGLVLATAYVVLSIYHFYRPPTGLHELGNRNVLAAILLLIIPFGAKIKDWDLRLLWFVWTGWAMITTTSRGGLLGLAVALAVLWGVDKRVLIGVCATALPVLIVWKKGTAIVRLRYWEAALQAFFSRPILGIGPASCYQWISPRIGNELVPHAHNIFLTFLAEMGVMGLAAFGLLLWQIWRHRRPGPAWAALVGFMVHSLVDDPIWFWAPGLGVMSLLAITMKGEQSNGE